jgi:hypothetical protein
MPEDIASLVATWLPVAAAAAALIDWVTSMAQEGNSRGGGRRNVLVILALFAAAISAVYLRYGPRPTVALSPGAEIHGPLTVKDAFGRVILNVQKGYILKGPIEF